MNNRIKILFIVIIASCSISTKSFAQTSTWFTDVTDIIGPNSMDTVWNYRIYAVDVNNDDYPDLLLEYGNMAVDQLRLFINTADATGANGRKFVETTSSSGINPPSRSSDMCSVADFNNDGNVDFITNVWVNDCNNATLNALAGPRIFLGDGTGHFTMSTTSGLETIDPEMAGSGLPVLDFDRDGNLDFFCGTQFNYCSGAAGPKYLFKGNGDGTFTNVTSGSGVTANNNPLFGANVADWNNDCYQDILTAPYTTGGNGNLFKNNGDGTFTDVASSAGYNPHWLTGDNGQAMVPWEAMPYDYDNDGDMDFLVMEVHGGTGAEGRSSIFTNQGAANNYNLVPELDRITRDNPQASHKGDHKGNWIDMDNDGLVDIVLGEGGYSMANERLYFLKQDTANHFNDITTELGWITGTTVAPEIRGPHAVEPLDFDLDGDDDIVVGCLYSVITDKRFLILQNNIGSTNNWIKIKLSAPAGVNKSCIGARVTVKADGLTQMRDLYAGQGHFGGQQPFAMNFGLGTSTIDTIIVRWPDAYCSQTIITNGIPVNQMITINATGIISSVKQIDKSEGFNIYPNPLSGDELNVQTASMFQGIIEVHNALGQKIFSQEILNNNSLTINLQLETVAQGVYSISLKNSNGNVATKSFVVLK